MTVYKITSPAAEFEGRSCGVMFVDGRATVDTGQNPDFRKAVAYFQQASYGVETVEPEATTAPTDMELPPAKATKEDWVAAAVAAGHDETEMKKATKDQIIALLTNKEQTA